MVIQVVLLTLGAVAIAAGLACLRYALWCLDQHAKGDFRKGWDGLIPMMAGSGWIMLGSVPWILQLVAFIQSR